eukprot:221659-Pleurochrysis_carterae.AAC.2
MNAKFRPANAHLGSGEGDLRDVTVSCGALRCTCSHAIARAHMHVRRRACPHVTNVATARTHARGWGSILAQ